MVTSRRTDALRAHGSSKVPIGRLFFAQRGVQKPHGVGQAELLRPSPQRAIT
jgi:hypothetical protein